MSLALIKSWSLGEDYPGVLGRNNEELLSPADIWYLLQSVWYERVDGFETHILDS